MAFSEDSGFPPWCDSDTPYPKLPISPAVAAWNALKAKMEHDKMVREGGERVTLDGNDIAAEVFGFLLGSMRSNKVSCADRIAAAKALSDILWEHRREAWALDDG